MGNHPAKPRASRRARGLLTCDQRWEPPLTAPPTVVFWRAFGAHFLTLSTATQPGERVGKIPALSELWKPHINRAGAFAETLPRRELREREPAWRGQNRGSWINNEAMARSSNWGVGLGPFVETLPTSGKVQHAVNILGTSVSFKGAAAAFKVVSKSEIETRVAGGASTGFVTVTTSCKNAEAQREVPG